MIIEGEEYKECKNKKPKPEGNWMIRDGKSYALCKRCGGWYQTQLMQIFDDAEKTKGAKF